MRRKTRIVRWLSTGPESTKTIRIAKSNPLLAQLIEIVLHFVLVGPLSAYLLITAQMWKLAHKIRAFARSVQRTETV
jgi:hypothetical protein